MPYVTRERDTQGIEGPVGSSLYGVCHTDSDVALKIVDLSDFDKLIPGVTIHVKFAHTNTAVDPLMDVNGTGILPLISYGDYRPGLTPASSWNDDSIITLTYDGNAWVINGYSNADSQFIVDNELSDTSVNPVQNRVIKQALDTFSGVLHYRGTKPTVASLPQSGNIRGDVWLVEEDDSEYIWNGSRWEQFGPTIDLSSYATIAYVDERIDRCTTTTRLNNLTTEGHYTIIGSTGKDFPGDVTGHNGYVDVSSGTSDGYITQILYDLNDQKLYYRSGVIASPFIWNEWKEILTNNSPLVTGVKGGSESSYRTGNVSITKANIGLGNVDNTADANKNVKTTKYRAPMVLGSSFDLNLLSDKSFYPSEVYNGISALNCNFPVEEANHPFVIEVSRTAFASGSDEYMRMLAYDIADQKYYIRSYFTTNSTWSSWHEIFTDSSSVLSILSYGNSTWNDFLSVYEKNRVVYCRASSNSDPSSGSQTRMAFLAYVNNAANPTEVEFQYYRSVSSHTASQQGDQVFVYKLTSANGGTWTVTTREASSKIIAGTGLGSSYSNGALTLTADVTGIRGSSESSYRTGNVTIAKADIGLGNVDNTSDVNKPVSTAQQTALNLKAPLASPALTGTPTAPTPTSSSGNTQIANKEYVDNSIPDLSGYMQKGVDYVTAGQLSGTTLGSKATAEGDYATASGQYSHAEGNHVTASGIGSHAEGAYAEASAPYAHAEGGNTTASDNYSHAEGEYTEASGEASHAEGGGYYNRHSTASGDYSHVEGSINVASGHSSHAEGQGNTASGNYSHAGGGSSEASASASFAHGVGLIADQENGFAFGKYNKTIAHSINAVVTVGNDASFNSAEQILAITLSNATIRMNVVNNNGYTYFVYKDHTGTITYPLYFEYDTYKKETDTYYNHYKSSNLVNDSGLSTYFSFGYANITSTSPTPETLKNVVVNENNVNYQVASVMDSAESGISILEMIGNGSDSSHRSNARTLDSNGNETLAGKLTLGTAPENDMDAATKKYVDDNSSDIQVRQSNSTGNQNKRVLLSTAANDNTETGEVYKSGSLTYNPSLATLYCTKYSVANAVVISYDSTEQAIIFTF